MRRILISSRHLRRWARNLVMAVGLLTLPAAGLAAPIEAGRVQVWVTSADRTKLLSREPDLTLSAKASPRADEVAVDPRRRGQRIVGFGAALTDASAWLIQNRMTEPQRRALLDELFGPAPGLGLSFTRLTIGASDFSRTHYTFDDRPQGEQDPALAAFSIEPNRADVLPIVKRMLAVNPRLQVMASPWSAPGWMKTNDSLVKGSLRPEAYPAFAAYLARYVEAYEREGVPIYALTLQNEPHFEPGDYPGMRVDPAARTRFIGDHLGPTLARRGLRTRLLEWDHNWDEPQSPLAVLADPKARRYVAGVAWHCYAGDVSAQGRVRAAHPDKDVFLTECSGGEWAPWKEALPWMARNLIVRATREHARGVLLWNLALDETHGPHLGGCGNCNGVVTIDSRTGEVSRNVEYYVLGHASRFVRPGARRIDSASPVAGVDTVAFRNPDDGSLVLIAVNPGPEARSFTVRQGDRSFAYGLAAGSVATFVWR